MKYTLWVALATGLAGLTGLHATSPSSDTLITTTPLAVTQPVTIVNPHPNDHAIANAKVNFVDDMYNLTGTTTKREQIGVRHVNGYDMYNNPMSADIPVYGDVTYYQYGPAPQKVFNNGSANNDKVIGAQTDGAPTLYVR